MSLHLNLLHEEIAEHRQRQRDPLKLGMLALSRDRRAHGPLLHVEGVSDARRQTPARSVQREWAKVEPKVTAAQKRSKELNDIISTTKVLDAIVEGRFYWAPLLQNLSRCVAPNAQLTSHRRHSSKTTIRSRFRSMALPPAASLARPPKNFANF